MPGIWTRDALRKLLGDVDDSQLTAILALEPSRSDVELAVARLSGEETELAEGWAAVHGKAAEIVNILTVDEDEER